MKVAVFNTKSYERTRLDKFNIGEGHELIYFDFSINEGLYKLTSGFNAVCITISDKIDKEIISRLLKQNINLIALRSAGFDNVDLGSFEGNSIKVMRVPSYSPQSIAEHAVALILTLNRKIHKAYNRVRENNFSLDKLMGYTLFGKTVGVVGTGKIGIAFCNIMLGFGCKIIAFDIIKSDALLAKGVEYVPFDKLLRLSDIISIHCPLNVHTRHLFNKKSFNELKNGTMLINTSRGAIIETKEAIIALKTGQLGYLGIDVYENEQSLFFKDLSDLIIQDDIIERLMSFNNVLITPHQAFFTEEALDQIAFTTIKNFTDFENGLPSENEVKNELSAITL